MQNTKQVKKTKQKNTEKTEVLVRFDSAKIDIVKCALSGDVSCFLLFVCFFCFFVHAFYDLHFFCFVFCLLVSFLCFLFVF